MEDKKALGWVLFVVGVILVLSGVLWGRAGYYVSQTPILLLLVVGGGVLAFLGGRMLRKPPQPTTPVQWRGSNEDEGSDASDR